MERAAALTVSCLVGFFISAFALFTTVRAQGITCSIKGTVSASTNDPAAHPASLAGARLSLVNKDLLGTPLKTVADDAGNFAYLDLPAGKYLLTAEAAGLPTVSKEIGLTTGATVILEIVLTATVSESVTVREEEGLLSTAETTTSNTVRSQTLKELPLRAENYQSALPLTPGVVRGSDGADHIKGTRAGDSAFAVNGADVTDPVSGNLAFDIPIEAAASVQIEENPYSAELGRFTGGVTNLETKSGGDKIKIETARVFPTFHNFVKGQIDSFRPRVTLSGPVIRNRLYFLQSFEYRFSRTQVPGLVAPHDHSSLEGANSFSQLDLTVNKSNRLKFVAAFFPQRLRFLGLNIFNPQETTRNTKQRGDLFSLSETSIFKNESFLSSLVTFKTLHFAVLPQGPQPLTVLPDGNSGNYFAQSDRGSRRLQWQENYYAHPFTLSGQHSVKFGIEFARTSMSGLFTFKPILIRRRDQTLSQRIDFTASGPMNRSLDELAAFVQDRWVFNKKLTVDAGMRFDRDSIARQSNFAPRLSLMYLPLKGDRTIVRGGLGLFYGRNPLWLRYFDLQNEDALLSSVTGESVALSRRFPQRIVTTFGPDGFTVIDGPRRFANSFNGTMHNSRSVRWSMQLDRGLTKRLVARVCYLQRSTTNEPVVVPSVINKGGILALSTSGRSQYRELQMLVTYSSERLRNWNVSYVWSSARGDLNTADNFLGDFPSLVIRPNEYGPLPFDTTHRLIAYGDIKTRWGVSLTPALEIRSGFPFSKVNDRLEYIGARNQAGRFPTYLSLDAQILKSLRIPFIDKRVRVGIAVFNLTHHFNPTEVQNNTGSLRFGQFFSSFGTSVRGKFEMDF